MNKYKRFLALALSLALIFSLGACGAAGKANDPPPATASQPGDNTAAPAQRQVLAQGITEDTIYIGSTMSTSGSYALVGVPVMDALRGVFNRVNKAGGIDGRQIEFVYYDDTNDPATGRTLVERLVEEDKVFALNCLPGTIVSTALDYIRDQEIPAVYITTGLNVVYNENDPGGNIFPVQPNLGQDGGFLAARVFNEAIFGAGKNEKLPDDAKVGALYINNDTGNDLYAGFMAQAEAEGRTGNVVSEGVASGTYATAIQKFKDQGCKAVVVLMGDVKNVIAAMDDIQFEVPVLASYSNSSVTAWSTETYKESRPTYTTAWANYSTEEAKLALEDFYDALQYADVSQETKDSYRENNYARAGYVAGVVLVEGLQRLADSGMDYSWENFITCMESDLFHLITGSSLDYSNGQRRGSTQECLLEYYATTNTAGAAVITSVNVRPFETLEEIMAK